MYAIIVDGGRQYQVVEGEELDLDYRDAAAGTELKFDQVLAVGDGANLKIGQPTVAGALVTASVLGPALGPKLVVQRLRRRKTYRKKNGHRQLHTQVRIQRIEAP